ncbi:MAG: hypothetical protein U9N77_01960 [Thermodesulfobacteriota bacterium]|nr:hypothetical protein [Thermodesulfobacteriota bacterium]
MRKNIFIKYIVLVMVLLFSSQTALADLDLLSNDEMQLITGQAGISEKSIGDLIQFADFGEKFFKEKGRNYSVSLDSEKLDNGFFDDLSILEFKKASLKGSINAGDSYSKLERIESENGKQRSINYHFDGFEIKIDGFSTGAITVGNDPFGKSFGEIEVGGFSMTIFGDIYVTNM